MKKILIIVSVVFLVIIAGGLILFKFGANIENGNSAKDDKIKDYYTGIYLGSYNEPNVRLDNQNFSIIRDKNKLDEILSKLDSKEFDDKIFDDNYFKDKSLVVVEGRITPQLNELGVDKNKVYIDYYYGTPETTSDEKLKHTLYFIPVEKTVENVIVNADSYPDRVY